MNTTAPDEKSKKEFLERNEVKTMEKEISRLRELEAAKERERISKMENSGNARKENLETSPESAGQNGSLTEGTRQNKLNSPGRSSLLSKILIRLAIVLLLVFIFGFFYWFFAVR